MATIAWLSSNDSTSEVESARLASCSIVVCTYQRAASLADTLAALRQLRIAPGRTVEVIVVDNNSSDATRSTVEAQMAGWPALRYEFEGQQGLSHARNCGITAARGEIILFTDDDVLPDPDWLEVTVGGLDRYAADACGGYIAPLWEVPPPEWLTERFYGFLAVRTDREDDYVIDSPSRAPYGANMAFRRSVFERVGDFDTRRGRKGKVLASGEDGEMFERILAAGLKAVFLGRSRVSHKVEAFRMTKGYMRRWRMQTSRNLALSKGIPGGRRILNVPLFLFPQVGRAVWRMFAAKFAGPAEETFHRELLVFHFIGTIHGLTLARRQSRMGSGSKVLGN